MFRVGIVTLSDKGAKGEREDLSGKKIIEMLPKEVYEVVSYRLLPDEKEEIQAELIRLSEEENCHLVLTTGGTGFSKRDITPEATLAVAERVAPGIAEGMRGYSMKFTPRAMLSRGVAVLRKDTLIINLPGSVKGVTENMEFLLGKIEHGLKILLEEEEECGKDASISD